MNQIAQKGAITLLVTSLLLLVALIVSLASFKGTFYQIKVAQNEVKSRQEHWKAEGGLECGFTHIVNLRLNAIPNNLPTICNVYSFSYLDSDPIEPEVLRSKFGSSELDKTIVFGGGGGSGAIRSTSDIISFGSALFSPPDPGPFNSSADGYECVGAVVKNHFIATGISSHGVGSRVPSPGSGHNSSKDCLPSHKTSSGGLSGIWKNSSGDFVNHNSEKDIQRDETISPFKDFFGVDKSKWQEVRDDPANKFIKVTMPSGSVDCYRQFSGSLITGKPNKVWINGSCQLTSSDVTSIVQLQASNPGTHLLLLVHNGVLGIIGSGEISGMFFHFNNSYVPNASQWNAMAEIKPFVNAVFDTSIKTIYGSKTSLTPHHATFAQVGSFRFTGGQFFDTNGQMALFNNSLNFSFNSDVINEFSFSSKPSWKKGSWNDL